MPSFEQVEAPASDEEVGAVARGEDRISPLKTSGADGSDEQQMFEDSSLDDHLDGARSTLEHKRTTHT